MLNKISKKQALQLTVWLITAVISFHLLLIIQLIPYKIVWAGKLHSDKEMYVFETISILINLFLLILLLLKGNFIKHNLHHKLINGVLWFFVFIFALNTIGNLMAETRFEKIVFTPLTLILAILIWIIVRKDKPKNA